VPAFGTMRLEDVTAERIEGWKTTVAVGNRQQGQILTILNGVLKRACRVHKLGYNAMADVEKPHFRATTRSRSSGLRRCGPSSARRTPSTRGRSSSRQRSPVCAAASSLRCAGATSTSRPVGYGHRLVCRRPVTDAPKSGKVRSVPLAPDVASALARHAGREAWTGDDDLVFPGVLGGYLGRIRQRLSGQRLYPVIEMPDGEVYRAESKEMAARIASGGLGEVGAETRNPS
jgi:integrase